MEISKHFKYGETEISHLRKKDKKLGAVIDHVGILTRPVNTDVFASLVESIISQQISAKAANTVCKRLYDMCEMRVERLARLTIEEVQSCGMSMRKAEYVKGIADVAISKTVDFDALTKMSDDEIIKSLTAIKGIGIWTVEMLLIFSLMRPDVVSFGDLAIRRGMMRLYNLKELSKDRFERYAKRYSPYGSVASLYLWHISDPDVDISVD